MRLIQTFSGGTDKLLRVWNFNDCEPDSADSGEVNGASQGSKITIRTSASIGRLSWFY
jgi:hypothetical protein